MNQKILTLLTPTEKNEKTSDMSIPINEQYFILIIV